MILTVLLIVFLVLWFVSLFPAVPQLAGAVGWLAFICVLLIAIGARLPIHG